MEGRDITLPVVEGNNKVITIQSDSVSEAEPDRATSSASAAPKIVTLSSDSDSSSDEDTSDSSSDYDPSDSSSDEDTSDSDSDEEVGSTPAKKAKVSRNESPETAKVAKIKYSDGKKVPDKLRRRQDAIIKYWEGLC